MKVMQEVPYVYGLDKYLKDLPDEDTIAYLKDFGAATASNGAVGLYHIDKITPEAKELSLGLIKDNAKEYIIDDEELERVYKSYPIMWKKTNAKPHKCFIGCPHLTLKQLQDWTDKIVNGLKESGKEKLVCNTILTASPAVIAGAKTIITNSNKLRTYSKSRYYKDEEILNIIVGKEQVK